jgi:hypothetical protein
MNVKQWTLLVALLAPASAYGQDLRSARAFTLGLYDSYQRAEPDVLGRRAQTTFAPHLLALIRKDQRTTPAGYVGLLDSDPICACQDPDGLKVLRLTVAGAGRLRARATVTLQFQAERRRVTLDLVSRDGGWRVADVHTADMPSLVGMLGGAVDGTPSTASRSPSP